MENKIIGFIISVYDRLDDLKINLELIQSYKINKHIFVSCPQDAPISKIKEICSRYSVTLLSHETISINKKSNVLTNASLSNRVWDTQRFAIKEASRYCDIVIHTHSDCWLMNFEKFIGILRIFIANKVSFGFRGVGITKVYFPGAPLGSIDDHFMIFNSTLVRNSNFLDKEYKELFPGILNIHGIWSLFLYTEIGTKNYLHYDNGQNWFSWDNKKVDHLRGNPLRPYVYNKNLSIIHCHISDFPRNTGKNLQANLLLKHKLKGEFINEFIEKYKNKNVEKELIQYRKKLKLKLLYRFETNKFHNNLNYMEIACNSNMSFKILFNNLMRSLFRLIFPKGYRLKNENKIYPLDYKEFYIKNKLSEI